MKKSRYTDTQIVNILKQNQAGESTANLCREYGMSQATFYKCSLMVKFVAFNITQVQIAQLKTPALVRCG
jgi:putative transposase